MKSIKSYLVVITLIMTDGVLSVAKAQNIGINATSNTPDVSAALDSDMTNKGLFIPLEKFLLYS